MHRTSFCHSSLACPMVHAVQAAWRKAHFILVTNGPYLTTIYSSRVLARCGVWASCEGSPVAKINEGRETICLPIVFAADFRGPQLCPQQAWISDQFSAIRFRQEFHRKID